MTILTDIVDQFNRIDRQRYTGTMYADTPDCYHELIDCTDPERPYCYQCGISFDGFGNPMLGVNIEVLPD
jgi:hypothetical protein